MAIEEIIKQRRTIHDYKTQHVDVDILKRALALGIMAPNHRLTFPWKFVIAGSKAKENLSQLAVDLKSAQQELSESKVTAIKSKFTSPSYLIGLAIKKCNDEFQFREDYATMACSVQNISLYLWEQGVGSKWSSGAVTTNTKTYQMLEINSDEYEIVGFLWVGIALRVPKASERPPIESFITEID